MIKAMRALFVAEKNDAAKNIAGILSRGQVNRRDSRSKWNKIYQFQADILGASMCTVAMTSVSGHLLQHKFPDSHRSWTETPMISLFDAPVYKDVIPGMEDIKRTLAEEIRGCGVLVIWTDCDREGENIGAEIMKVCAEVSPAIDIYRAKFSEITQSAIWRAVGNLTRIDQNIVDAVECRSELDLRIGAAFTRLQTLHLRNLFANIFRDHKDVISYGSCQFPTLGFVVERYKAIQEFLPETFWKLVIRHKYENLCIEFIWDRYRLFNKDVVEALLEDCQEADQAEVVSVICKPKSKWRPVALDTIELEKLAVRKLKISAKTAMSIAEKLYSKGYISYPRTETNKYPSNLNLRPLIELQTVNTEWGDFAHEVLTNGPYPRNGSKSDDAHPPIHPLKFATTNDLVGLDWAIYELVVRHFLASVSSDAKGRETKVHVKVGNECFTATGLIVDDLGYLKVYKYESWGDKLLPRYRESELLANYQLLMLDGVTQPPPLLTEADLISLMDKYGIGTDATHAEHIETIKLRQYACLNKDNRFVPGYLGLSLVDGYDRMGFAMSKPHMRADLESNLKLICQGQKDKNDVLLDQLMKYKRIFEQSELKIKLLSDTFREYLKTHKENKENHSANLFVNQQPRMPNEEPVIWRGTAARGGRKSHAVRRRAGASEPEVATTNMDDVVLLGLSILNTGRRGRRGTSSRTGRGRGGGTRGGVTRGGGSENTVRRPSAESGRNNRNENSQEGSQDKKCRCGEYAMWLVVKKEGPNQGRHFWTCRKDRNSPSKCNFFEWDKN